MQHVFVGSIFTMLSTPLEVGTHLWVMVNLIWKWWWILNLSNEFCCPCKLHETNTIKQNVQECPNFIQSHLSWFQVCNGNASLDLSIWTKSQKQFPICKTKTSKVVCPYNQKALVSSPFATSKVLKTKPDSYYIEKQ